MQRIWGPEASILLFFHIIYYVSTKFSSQNGGSLTLSLGMLAGSSVYCNFDSQHEMVRRNCAEVSPKRYRYLGLHKVRPRERASERERERREKREERKRGEERRRERKRGTECECREREAKRDEICLLSHSSVFLSDQLAERVYGLLLVQSLLLQVVLTSFVPYIGMPIAFFYSCWLYSFLATQYEKKIPEGRREKEKDKGGR
jgi:hypothetical protein